MSPDTRLLVYALGAVVALIVLIARLKVHPGLQQNLWVASGSGN